MGGNLDPHDLDRHTVGTYRSTRTYDQLWAAVGQVCDLFSDEECYNYFKAAGYEAD